MSDEEVDLSLDNLDDLERYVLAKVAQEAEDWIRIDYYALAAQSKDASTKFRQDLYKLNKSLEANGLTPSGEITDWDREYLAIVAEKESE